VLHKQLHRELVDMKLLSVGFRRLLGSVDGVIGKDAMSFLSWLSWQRPGCCSSTRHVL
jgi:hypothetical protein